MGLGHEGVGVIEEVGPQVTYMKKGDRVGWGYEHDSCGHCEQCLKGAETYCAERAMYAMADLDQGSFASHAVWREAFLFPIPDGLSDEVAAPLMVQGPFPCLGFQQADISCSAEVAPYSTHFMHMTLNRRKQSESWESEV
jgi:D-arabinose 1-dehydrogenase-like Zn-dependent alcohol dehydrogenase